MAEYRFLVVEGSLEIYAGLIAALFAGLGIWLGLTLKRRKQTVIVREVPAAGSSRLFDKLGAKRRTQAVQIAQALRLIP